MERYLSNVLSDNTDLLSEPVSQIVRLASRLQCA